MDAELASGPDEKLKGLVHCIDLTGKFLRTGSAIEDASLSKQTMISFPAKPARSIGEPAPGPILLHIFPSFAMGGVPLRTCRIINYFGRRFRHMIIALDRNFEAIRHVLPEIDVDLLTLERRRSLFHDTASAVMTLRRIKPDLLVTYNWGSIEWAIANRLLPVAPQLHFEDGFGRRVLCRHLALARCKAVVVPSRLLADIAHHTWRLPAETVTYIPNGVNAERFSALPPENGPVLARRRGELIVGTLAPLRPEKNLGRLLRVFARIDTSLPVRLLIAGDGIERNALEQLARRLGLADRVIFTGHVSPEAALGCLDIFTLSSDTEQMPIALLEAMAARLPIAAVDVGDVKTMVSPENQDFIVTRDDDAAFVAAIERLLHDPATRERLGDRNRERVMAEFSLQRMFDRYSDLFYGLLNFGQNKSGYGRLHSGP
jgi:L-malate glycosyltransferase